MKNSLWLLLLFLPACGVKHTGKVNYVLGPACKVTRIELLGCAGGPERCSAFRIHYKPPGCEEIMLDNRPKTK